MADPGRRQRVLGGEHGEHGVGERVDVRRGGQRRGAAVAGQVDGDHPLPLGERGCEQPPVRDRSAEPVHERERRPRTADGVPDGGRAPHDLPRLESAYPRVAVRHHLGIFFA